MLKKSLDFRVLLGIVTLFGVTGCGSESGSFSFVNAVHIQTYQQEGDAWGTITMGLDTGAIQLPAASIPIRNPKTADSYGVLEIHPSLGGGGELAIHVNIDGVARTDSDLRPLLPNGSRLPMGGVLDSEIVVLQADRALVYFAFSPNVALVGAAIPIREFDRLGNSIGGANLFPGFSLPGGVRGVAGIFTGSVSGQSGIALFVDGGSLLPNLPGNSLQRSLANSPEIQFRSLHPDSDQEEEINYFLYKLHRKESKVHLR